MTKLIDIDMESVIHKLNVVYDRINGDECFPDITQFVDLSIDNSVTTVSYTQIDIPYTGWLQLTVKAAISGMVFASLKCGHLRTNTESNTFDRNIGIFMPVKKNDEVYYFRQNALIQIFRIYKMKGYK